MIRRFIHISILMLLLFFAEKQAMGQDFPWSLQYITNMHILNPAYVGMWDKSGFMLSTRKDYASIGGSAFYQQFSYHKPVKDEKRGLGFNIQRRSVGREKKLFFTGDYSYQVRLDMYNYLRLGLRAGFVNYDNNTTDYQLYPDQIPDPEFLTDIHMYFMTVFGFGAVFFNDHLYVSLSVPQVINNTFKVNRVGYSSLHEFSTVYLSAGYVFKLPQDLHIRPNLLVVGSVGKPVYFDAAAVLYLPINLQLGLNIRSTGSTCVSSQYTFGNNLRIGFAADFALFQDIRKFQLGTYEFLVG